MHSTPKRKSERYRQSLGLGEPQRQGPSSRHGSPGPELSTSVQGGRRGPPARASKVGHRFPTSHNVRDPRPIGDKAFSAQCARSVAQFLTARHFHRTLTPQCLLQNPSTKEFADIFRFLIEQVDPTLELEDRLENEVSAMMRKLKYPVEVNKSKLQAVGAPGSWPHLLALLDWLVALASWKDAIVEPLAMAECRDGEMDDAVIFNRSCFENYVQYLAGTDDNSHEQRVRRHFEDKIGALQAEIQFINQTQEATMRRIQELMQERGRLAELQAAPRTLYIEVDRERSTLSSLDLQVHALEDKLVSQEGVERDLKDEEEELLAEVRQLTEQVAGQSCTRRDIDRLKCERERLRGLQGEVRSDVERVEQELFELGVAESTLGEDISRAARGANEWAERLVLALPELAGEDLMVRADILEAPDVLGALEWSRQKARVEAAAVDHAEAAYGDDAMLQKIREEQRTAQEQLSEEERKLARLACRQEQLCRMRDDQRAQTSSLIEERVKAAELVEDAVHAIPLCLGQQNGRAQVEQGRRQLQSMKESFAEKEQKALDDMQSTGQEMDQAFASLSQQMAKHMEALEALVGAVSAPAEEGPPEVAELLRSKACYGGS